ncbi:MAG TPA: hypothetical protein VND94_23440 [Terriglobia bacterium]|nr:hypothetical protein [Terriglobia bacterium]
MDARISAGLHQWRQVVFIAQMLSAGTTMMSNIALGMKHRRHRNISNYFRKHFDLIRNQETAAAQALLARIILENAGGSER